jgi:hypothetical protein
VKRVLILLLVVVLTGLAWTLPVPQAPTLPSITSTTSAVASTPSHSTCPWAYSDATVDTYLVAQSGDPADIRFTFPVAGEVSETREDHQGTSAATALSLASVLNQGIDPAVVEFSSSPSAAGIVEAGEGVLAVDTCPSSSSKIWHLPGGSTLDGQSLLLVLFNPFSEDARASIAVKSELGPEALTDLEAVTVTGRTWKVIDLAAALHLRESLSVAIDMKQGALTPVMVFGEGTDVGVWTNEGQAEQWDFPIVNTGGLNATLSVSNDAVEPVDYQVDVYTQSGAEAAALTGTVAGSSHVALPIGGLAEAPFGIRVTTGGPTAATVISADGSRVAATSGIAEPQTHWMLPGFGIVGTSRFWVMNSGTDTATVTYRSVDANGASGDVDKVAVPPATVVAVAGLPLVATGLEVESNVPVSVAWSDETSTAIGFTSGVPVP